MKTRAFALLALAAALGGCRENLTSIAHHGFCTPPVPAETGMCSASAACDLYVNGVYELWLGTAAGLVAWIEWENNLPENVDGVHLNTNDFYLQEYEYTFSSAIPIPSVRSNFTTEVWIPAGSRSNIGLALIPSDTAAYIQGEMALAGITDLPVRVEVKAHGRLGDASGYETGTAVAAVIMHSAAQATYTCPKAGDVVKGVCPGFGQEPMTVTCGTP